MDADTDLDPYRHADMDADTDLDSHHHTDFDADSNAGSTHSHSIARSYTSANRYTCAFYVNSSISILAKRAGATRSIAALPWLSQSTRLHHRSGI
jgi:hypothetical protein